MIFMPRKPLSQDEIEILRLNPNVLYIASGKIFFTPAFKKLAYLQLLDGKRMADIFQDNGIDPAILGNRRIWSFTRALRENAGREDAFEDQRIHNCRVSSDSPQRSMAERIEQLEHELAYTQQEVEFLKKIQQADLEARKRWESKQRQK